MDKKPFKKRVKLIYERVKSRCCAGCYRLSPASWEPEREALAQGLKEKAARFVGLYEPVYQVSRGAMRLSRSAFGEWCLRVENLEGGDDFTRLFLALFSAHETWDTKETVRRAAFLTSCFERAGMLRDENHGLIADPSTGERYSSMDGEDFTPGEKLKVKKPCWTFNKDLLERGLVIRMNAEQEQ